MKNSNRDALFSDGTLNRLRGVLEEKFPKRTITNSELIEAAIKITQFVAISELKKGKK